MNPEIKLNYCNKNLWCDYSKERICIGEEYFTVVEIYNYEKIVKHYKIEYKDFIDNEE
jgi:hypothetical protein